MEMISSIFSHSKNNERKNIGIRFGLSGYLMSSSPNFMFMKKCAWLTFRYVRQPDSSIHMYCVFYPTQPYIIYCFS